MRRWIAGVLCVVLLLTMTACGLAYAQSEAAGTETVRLYYCSKNYADLENQSAEKTYGTETGALNFEKQNMTAEQRTVDGLMERYLQGPQTENLYFPLQESREEIQWKLRDKILTVKFGTGVQSLSKVEKSLLAACLVHTMTQLPEVTGLFMPEFSGAVLRPNNFLLLDDTAINDNMMLRLYFSDESGRYLRAETRYHQFQENESVPTYAIRQLLQDPENEENRRAMPHGTRLYWSRMDDGVCTINLSEEFLSNAPETHLRARAAVFSIVNTLTELPELESVQFLCSGLRVENYVGLDLSHPLYREEQAILSAKDEQGHYDATLYLPCGVCEELVPVPVMLPDMETKWLPQEVLRALIAYEPINGYRNPIPKGTVASEVRVSGGTCKVVFNNIFTMCDTSQKEAVQAVRSVVSTLCSLENIDQVQIEIMDGTMSSVDLSEPLSVDSDWLHP